MTHIWLVEPGTLINSYQLGSCQATSLYTLFVAAEPPVTRTALIYILALGEGQWLHVTTNGEQMWLETEEE